MNPYNRLLNEIAASLALRKELLGDSGKRTRAEVQYMVEQARRYHRARPTHLVRRDAPRPPRSD